MFTDLIEEDGQAIQANQFLIVDHGTGAIIDPGGNLAFNELFMGMSRHFPPQKLAYLIASHADPDIIASLDRWMSSTRAQLVISRIWERFAPHFTKVGKTENRVIGCPMRAGACRWAIANWCCCPRISCMPRATSTSTTRSARFCSRATWAYP